MYILGVNMSIFCPNTYILGDMYILGPNMYILDVNFYILSSNMYILGVNIYTFVRS